MQLLTLLLTPFPILVPSCGEVAGGQSHHFAQAANLLRSRDVLGYVLHYLTYAQMQWQATIMQYWGLPAY